MTKNIWTLLIFILSVQTAYSATDCGQFQTQSDINQCAANNFSSEKTKIIKSVNAYSAMLSNTEKKELLDTQQAWTTYRDKHCKFEASAVRQGSMYSYVLNTCLADLTRSRTEYLEDMKNCSNGIEPGCF